MPSYRVKPTGLKLISESPSINTLIRAAVADADQVSGYPSNGMLANVSKDTTLRELLTVDGVDKEEFKKQNINLFFGPVNQIEYCTTMYNFPTVYEIEEFVKNKIKMEHMNV